MDANLAKLKNIYPDGIPTHVMLNDEEGEALVRSLLMRIGLDPDDRRLPVLYEQSLNPVDCVNAKSSDFDLAAVLQALGVRPNREVYLYWPLNGDDPTDRLALDVVSANFHKIWFPGRDDVEVFDDTMTWILSINHSGDVFCYMSPQDPSVSHSASA